MEIPDVLVVTKADLGRIAARAASDLQTALRALGSPDTPVLPVSSLAPGSGIGDLVEALDAHRLGLDLPRRRLEARRLHALSDFVAEHGESGLRSLGGRRGAERWLAEQDPGLDVPAMAQALEEHARSS
jgi:LAO/AO transport system kinase